MLIIGEVELPRRVCHLFGSEVGLQQLNLRIERGNHLMNSSIHNCYQNSDPCIDIVNSFIRLFNRSSSLPSWEVLSIDLTL